MKIGRETISFGLCSALVNEVFPGGRAEELSFIACNARLPDNRWKEAVICETKNLFKKKILAAIKPHKRNINLSENSELGKTESIF